MKKISLLLVVLCLSAFLSIPSVLATWHTPTWSQYSRMDENLCSTLRSTCSRQKALNETASRMLERYGRYEDLGLPEVCRISERECPASTPKYYPQNSCIGICPDGTAYNSCRHSGTAYPCRNHQVTDWSNCQAGTVPERVCTNSYPAHCYTTCSPARSECVGYCANGRTYNICTMGPTYECLQ